MSRIGVDARFINDRYHGIGRYTFNLLEALTRLDKENVYFLLYDPASPNSRFDMGLLRRRPNVHLVEARLPLYLPQEQLALPLLMRRLDLGLWHTPYLAVPLLAPCPLLCTVHDLIFHRHPEFMSRRRFLWYYRLAARLSVQRARSVIAVSRATADELRQLYPTASRKVYAVPEGVEPRFRPVADRRKRGEVRRRYRLPPRFILSVGARRPSKNLARLVRAFGRLCNQVEYALVLAGPPDPCFPDEALMIARELGLEGRVVFPGFVAEEDLPTLYSLADLFVFPSLAEGFGLPPLEAMACGTPVVVSNIPPLVEVVGRAGLTVDPYSVEQLAAAMLRVLTDPALREELRNRGLRRAAQFTWETAARKTLAVYNDYTLGVST